MTQANQTTTPDITDLITFTSEILYYMTLKNRLKIHRIANLAHNTCTLCLPTFDIMKLSSLEAIKRYLVAERITTLKRYI